MRRVGNDGINRIRSNCSDFEGLRTISEMVYQPHGYEFYQRARVSECRLAWRALKVKGFGRQN